METYKNTCKVYQLEEFKLFIRILIEHEDKINILLEKEYKTNGEFMIDKFNLMCDLHF